MVLVFSDWLIHFCHFLESRQSGENSDVQPLNDFYEAAKAKPGSLEAATKAPLMPGRGPALPAPHSLLLFPGTLSTPEVQSEEGGSDRNHPPTGRLGSPFIIRVPYWCHWAKAGPFIKIESNVAHRILGNGDSPRKSVFVF